MVAYQSFLLRPHSILAEAQCKARPQDVPKNFPNGSSFDAYTQEDMSLAASHVNFYAHPGLDNKTLVEVLTFFYDKERAHKLLRLLGNTHSAGSDRTLY